MIFVIRLLTGRRRLLRKRMYKSPHERNRKKYFRENRSLNKDFQSQYVINEKVFTKRRPKREAISGFKMSYRYKYYNKDSEEEEEVEES